jgi:hypothetical protein
MVFYKPGVFLETQKRKSNSSFRNPSFFQAMLAADKAALESELKRRALEIQDKELNFFVNNLNSIATQSSLLAGFSFSALTLTDFKGVQGTSQGFKIAFYVVTTLSMSFQLVAVLMATLVCTYINFRAPILILFCVLGGGLLILQNLSVKYVGTWPCLTRPPRKHENGDHHHTKMYVTEMYVHAGC